VVPVLVVPSLYESVPVVRPGILGGSRVWKDESHDKGNHTRKADDASVYEG